MKYKIKHLEMIQNIITRFDNNSFLLKGWGVTLVTAAIALTSKESDKSYFHIAYLPIIIFWILDGYFVSVKRRYRALYDYVRKMPDQKIDFSLDSKPFKKGKNVWKRACLSRFLIIFYGALLCVVIIITTFY